MPLFVIKEEALFDENAIIVVQIVALHHLAEDQAHLNTQTDEQKRSDNFNLKFLTI